MIAAVLLFAGACSAMGLPNPHVARDGVDRTHLFKRQEYSYPQGGQKGPQPRQAWIDAYNAAKSQGLIPDVPLTQVVNGWPQYPEGVDPTINGICSVTNAACEGEGEWADVWQAPDGYVGIAFDDGPTPNSPQLYDFLEANNQTATHFMIGSNILYNGDVFDRAVAMGGHIASHTWSHQFSTSLTDMEILGELGWTQQIVYDRAGLLPAYWRPAYGDVDNRVRAIAGVVFGLWTVTWNYDSEDWTDPPASEIDARIQGFYAQPKSPGLFVLQHELRPSTISAFTRNYPNALEQGWICEDVATTLGYAYYLNADDNFGERASTEVAGSATRVTGYFAQQQEETTTEESSAQSTLTITSTTTSTSSGGESTVTSSASPSALEANTEDTTGAASSGALNAVAVLGASLVAILAAA